jgi:hypothetical protein
MQTVVSVIAPMLAATQWTKGLKLLEEALLGHIMCGTEDWDL